MQATQELIANKRYFERAFYVYDCYYFFVAAKNGISLPVILIMKSFPGNLDIQKAPE